MNDLDLSQEVSKEANKKVKVYISGPMTGVAELNRQAFERAAQRLRAMGHEPVIPGDLHPTNTPYGDALRNALRAMLECDQYTLLDGWERSRGARLEHEIGQAIGMEQITI